MRGNDYKLKIVHCLCFTHRFPYKVNTKTINIKAITVALVSAQK